MFKDRGFDHVLERDTGTRVPVLLIGAGDAAEVFIREMARDRNAAYKVLGVADEKGTRVGRRIHGVPVIGHLDDLAGILATLTRKGQWPQRFILTKPPTRASVASFFGVLECVSDHVLHFFRGRVRG